MNSKLYDFKEFENLRDLINNSVKLYGNNNAFIIKNKKENETIYEYKTYKNFNDDINSLGTILIKMGLKDKRIAVISNNRYEWAVSYFATLNGVGVIIPLDKSLMDNEIESSLQRSRADVVIFSENYIEIMEKIMNDKSTNVQKFICMDTTSQNNFEYFDTLLEKGKELIKEGYDEYLNTQIDTEKMSVLLFTSGTTSISKVVMLSQKNLISNVHSLRCAEKIYSTDINLAFLPFHHTFGLMCLVFFLSCGVANAFCDGLKHISKNLKEYKISIFVCVPLLIETIYKKILQEAEKKNKLNKMKLGVKICNFLLKFGIDIRRKVFKDVIDSLGGELRFIISGASAIDKNVAKGFNDFGILTVQGYGLTETSPVIAAENEKYIKYGSVGMPLLNIKVKIDNPNEEGIGEIIVQGPNVMLGYYENEEATKEALVDGWLYTGDLGYIDEEGYLFITGRKKTVIVLKNGKNVYPEELELLINQIPGVKESFVYAIPYKTDDVTIATKIVYDTEYFKDNLDNQKIFDILNKEVSKINQNLQIYKHIRKVTITDVPLIKTTTQKIKRYEEIKKG